MHRRALFIAASVLIAVSFVGAPDSRAQEATAQRPADIRLGSCASLGEVVVPLASVVVPAGETQGQAGATPVEQSVTTVPMLLDDMLVTGHAIAVHASPEQVGTPIACGEIGGALAEDGTLAVGLNAMNDSRISGAAYFAPSPEGDGTTVTLLLIDERAARRADGTNGVGGGTAPEDTATTDAPTTGAPAAVDEAAGPSDTTSTPGQSPAPAPAPATAGLDGISTISASNEDGENAKPPRNKDKATADRDANGNAGTASTDSADKGKERGGERADREGGAHAGEDGGANG